MFGVRCKDTGQFIAFSMRRVSPNESMFMCKVGAQKRIVNPTAYRCSENAIVLESCILDRAWMQKYRDNSGCRLERQSPVSEGVGFSPKKAIVQPCHQPPTPCRWPSCMSVSMRLGKPPC
jgi:hypothetical protein